MPPQKRSKYFGRGKGIKKIILTDKKKIKTTKQENYRSSILRVLKKIHPDLEISSEALSMMNNFTCDISKKLVNKSTELFRKTKKSTITENEIESATRVILPGKLATYGMVEATKAVEKFNSSKASSLVKKSATFVEEPSSVVGQPSSVIVEPSSVVGQPSSVVGEPSSVVGEP